MKSRTYALMPGNVCLSTACDESIAPTLVTLYASARNPVMSPAEAAAKLALSLRYVNASRIIRRHERKRPPENSRQQQPLRTARAARMARVSSRGSEALDVVITN